jgi:hypothetical protein
MVTSSSTHHGRPWRSMCRGIVKIPAELVKWKCSRLWIWYSIWIERKGREVLKLSKIMLQLIANEDSDDPIPRPVPVEQLNCDESKDYRMYGDACMPLPPPSKPAFTVTEVFGRPVRGTCPTIGRRHGSAPIRIDVVSEQHVSIKSSAAYKKSLSLEGQQCFTPECSNDHNLLFTRMLIHHSYR